MKFIKIKIKKITTRKLTNINGNTDMMFSLVNCSEFYQQNIHLLYLLVYTDKIIVGKERIKKKPKSMMTYHLFRPLTCW
jgi:hypothetical protein